MLKNLRIRTTSSNTEYKITGLSEKSCKDQTFLMKQRNESPGDGEVQSVEITVYEYFVKHRNIHLRYSADLPCINVGKIKRPTYFPLELCNMVSLQRYTKALSTLQRSSLVEKSRQKPHERMRVLTDAFMSNKYDADPLLRSSGISISTQFNQVEGRVLSAPRVQKSFYITVEAEALPSPMLPSLPFAPLLSAHGASELFRLPNHVDRWTLTELESHVERVLLPA